ncbi:hypothetical protein AXI70_gp01 [Cronobacter phage Dev-CD-23823]|uniref:Uncharacterized protein n=1 Tax=Cronobacter phage Dev-CD-23823 TaxID=1712539 RepID=A0A0K8IXL6_9CAUD|nr:hypothetical protein AXI70_gp01 [Cronobacter phage Dev-CD-23823]CUH74576.1 hypothetical protein [Cronobacter phage Dev-CD-23823]
MLNKVKQSKLKAESRKPVVKTAAEKIAELREYKRRGTRNATKEARRLKLGDLAYSKPSDHETGFNYGTDARKQRKQDKPAANKVKKESGFRPQTATWGSKTDATINSYFRNKRGDNMPKNK